MPVDLRRCWRIPTQDVLVGQLEVAEASRASRWIQCGARDVRNAGKEAKEQPTECDDIVVSRLTSGSQKEVRESNEAIVGPFLDRRLGDPWELGPRPFDQAVLSANLVNHRAPETFRDECGGSDEAGQCREVLAWSPGDKPAQLLGGTVTQLLTCVKKEQRFVAGRHDPNDISHHLIGQSRKPLGSRVFKFESGEPRHRGGNSSVHAVKRRSVQQSELHSHGAHRSGYSQLVEDRGPGHCALVESPLADAVQTGNKDSRGGLAFDSSGQTAEHSLAVDTVLA